MIKFAFRRNLIFPLQLLLWNFLRDTESSLISYFFEVNNFLLYTGLMFAGEFVAGLIFYLYQEKYLQKSKKIQVTNNLSFNYIYTKKLYHKKIDARVMFLIITSAFFDFSQFLLTLQIPKYITISNSLEQRLRGNFTIYNSLFYYFILKLPIFKHQSFSLIIIAICLLIIVITEFIFQEFNIFLTYAQFITALLFMLFIQFSNATVESIEKYLYEYYLLNPFYVLMLQGIFGLVVYSIYCILENPFDEVIKFKKHKTTSEFTILIFAFILYIILSGGKNSFRVVTTKIYSPMTTTFLDYILNPFYIIYYFVIDKDFISYGRKNYAYFIINLIISSIITFCGGVYNEFLILFCCGLEKDTHSQVTSRSNTENELYIFNDELDKESEE